MTSLPVHTSRLALAALLAALAFLALAPTRAEAFNCSASAVTGTVLTGPPIQPTVANAGAPDCADQSNGITVPLPPIVTANLAFARTTTEGSGPSEAVTASGGIGDLKVLSLASLPIPLPAIDLSSLEEVTIPGVATIDLRPLAEGLLPGGRLPNANLVELAAVTATATGRCVGGRPELTGQSSVAGLKILGVDTPLNTAVEQTVSLVNTDPIDPSRIDPAAVAQQLGVTLLPPLETTIRQVLDGLPNIPVPPTLANVKVTPGSQERVGDRLTQRALRIEASIAGTRIADLAIGEATVTSAGAQCAVGGVAQQALQCTTRRLVLIDVLPGRRRVQLTGAADRRFVGRRVSIFFTADGKRVARATVRGDGTFRATAALPSPRIRGTNAARYQARIGRERSLRLKLQRRMVVRTVRLSQRRDRVRIIGRISRPLASPVRTIEVRRRISCRRSAVVARIKPNRRGEFNVLLTAPPNQQAAVFRFATRVRKTTRNPKTYPTFTLPRFVDLGRS